MVEKSHDVRQSKSRKVSMQNEMPMDYDVAGFKLVMLFEPLFQAVL